MGSKQDRIPCPFASNHDDIVVTAKDPFSGERFIELRCRNCGSVKPEEKK